MDVGSNGRLRFDDYEVDRESGKLFRNGWPVKIQPQPLRVLGILLESPGEIVSRDQLRSRVWGDTTFVEYDQGLNYCVRQIRLALHDRASTPRYIEAVPKQGYRFIATVAKMGSDSEHYLPCGTADAEPILSSHQPNAPASSVPNRAHPTPWKRLIAAAAVIAALGVGWAVYHGGVNLRSPAAPKSLAVLPLRNLSGDPSQDHLAEGMTEELIGRLAGIHDLRVISRTSVMRFKDTKLSILEIARILRVDALVEGSVIREGSRIRVHAQLIRGVNEQQFWSATYDREMTDVLSLESDVAQSVAQKVEVTVSGQEHTRLATRRYVSPEVYECYLKGELEMPNSPASLNRMRAFFEEAIRNDPTFAPAYVGLANTYMNLGTIFMGASPAEMRPKVLSAATKALELDPNLAEAHALIAGVYQQRWRWKEAEAEYKRALTLKPNDPAARLGYAKWLLCQARTDEALVWARSARELDPYGTAGFSIAWILFNARRYDEAILELQSALAVHPDSAAGHWYMGFALVGKQQPEKAIPELAKTAALTHRSPGSLELLATAYGYAGHRTEALRLIEELELRRKESYVPAGAFINPYLALRD
ncbi:MAG: winged helix-turn-helix domain-containing protein [Bryobacteraceae bacterium]